MPRLPLTYEEELEGSKMKSQGCCKHVWEHVCLYNIQITVAFGFLPNWRSSMGTVQGNNASSAGFFP